MSMEIEQNFHKLQIISDTYPAINFKSKTIALGNFVKVNVNEATGGSQDLDTGMIAVVIEIDGDDYGIAYLIRTKNNTFKITKTWWYPSRYLSKCTSLYNAQSKNRECTTYAAIVNSSYISLEDLIKNLEDAITNYKDNDFTSPLSIYEWVTPKLRYIRDYNAIKEENGF